MKESIKSMEELYKKYQPGIYSFFYYQTSSRPTAEELSQEVFLRAFKALPAYRGEASLKTWLYSIAHNLYVTWYKRELKLKFEELDVNTIESLPSVAPGPEERLISRERSEEVRNNLNKLSDEYRTVIILSDLEELSYNEIAETLQWSLSKVKITLYRARIKFRAYCKIGGEGLEVSGNS